MLSFTFYCNSLYGAYFFSITDIILRNFWCISVNNHCINLLLGLLKVGQIIKSCGMRSKLYLNFETSLHFEGNYNLVVQFICCYGNHGSMVRNCYFAYNFYHWNFHSIMSYWIRLQDASMWLWGYRLVFKSMQVYPQSQLELGSSCFFFFGS